MQFPFIVKLYCGSEVLVDSYIFTYLRKPKYFNELQCIVERYEIYTVIGSTSKFSVCITSVC